jgi:hypothetical protein
MFRAIIIAFVENYAKQKWPWRVKFDVIAGGRYSDHCALNGYVVGRICNPAV